MMKFLLSYDGHPVHKSKMKKMTTKNRPLLNDGVVVGSGGRGCVQQDAVECGKG